MARGTAQAKGYPITRRRPDDTAGTFVPTPVRFYHWSQRTNSSGDHMWSDAQQGGQYHWSQAFREI